MAQSNRRRTRHRFRDSDVHFRTGHRGRRIDDADASYADRMIVSKISNYIGELERGDIVVFHATESKDYIKRVIAIPGDTLEYREDMLYINEEPVDEPYLDEFRPNERISTY